MTSGDEAATIDAFWRWWSSRYRDVLARAIEERRVREVLDPLVARLRRVHPNLVPDLRPGAGPGRVTLVVATRGEAPAGLVERVLAAAPEPDDRWEYASGDVPIADPREVVLRQGDRSVDLARMVVGMGLEPDEMVLELSVYHPELAVLGEAERDEVVRIALNTVAGHAPPRRYRVAMRVVDTPPEGAVDLAELRRRLAALEA